MSGRLLYSFFMLLALVVFLLVRQYQPRTVRLSALSWRDRIVLTLAAFVGGSLGSKLPFALSRGGWFTESAWLADGKTITTGLVGAYVAVEVAKLVLAVRARTGDAFALPLAVALAVGRWGCFFNGCCYGQATALPWGVDFGDGVRRHPTQVYECLFHLSMAAVLLVMIHRDWLRGNRLKLYLIAYGGYRFLTEFIRPEPVGFLGLTFYQGMAVLLVVGLTAQWLLDRREPARTTVEHVCA